MSEFMPAKVDDSGLIEGLSHEPFVIETAGWLIDETFELGYRPDFDNFFQYMDRVYGVSDDQAGRALEQAEQRILENISPHAL